MEYTIGVFRNELIMTYVYPPLLQKITIKKNKKKPPENNARAKKHDMVETEIKCLLYVSLLCPINEISKVTTSKIPSEL